MAMPIARRRLTLLKVLLGSRSRKCSEHQPRHRACQPRKSILKKDESVERPSRKLTWKDVPVPRGSTDASPSQHLKFPTRVGCCPPAGPPPPTRARQRVTSLWSAGV